MLTMRAEQMATLKAEGLRKFVDEMLAHLRKRCPKQTEAMDDAALRESIGEGIAQAGEHGVTDENDVRRFLEYRTQYGPEFGQSPDTAWAGKILADKELDGTQKMDRIDEYHLFVVQLGGQP